MIFHQDHANALTPTRTGPRNTKDVSSLLKIVFGQDHATTILISTLNPLNHVSNFNFDIYLDRLNPNAASTF